MVKFIATPSFFLRIAWPVLALFLLGGCAAPPPRIQELYSHVIQFDPDGHTLDPRHGTPLGPDTAKQFHAILKDMRTFLTARKDGKILVYVHGGLNSPDTAITAAQDHYKAMLCADPNCYPIFVIWDSSIGSTYGEHLFEVRQGVKNDATRAWAKIDFPIYFLSDLMVAIARAPTVWLQQRATDDEAVAAAFASMNSYNKAGADPAQYANPATMPADESPAHGEAWMQRPGNADALAFYLALNKRYYVDWKAHDHKVTTAMAVSIGRDRSQPADWIGRGLVYTLTIPSKALTSPLLDAFGTAGWRDMSRRAQTVVEGSSHFDSNGKPTPAQIDDFLDRGTTGGLEDFLTMLACELTNDCYRDHHVEVNLVGHSMGAMVLNEVLRRRHRGETEPGAAAPPSLPVDNIIYMAAACSIRDFAGSVVPYMQSPCHQNVHFYNLTLHPTAEMIEAEACDFVARGSLLCWIDDFLETPQTPLDRTLGRWDNIMQVPYVVPAELRSRCAIKAFDLLRPIGPPPAYPNWQPQKHGDFTDTPFWDEDFWKPADPLNPDVNPRIKAAESVQRVLGKK